MHALPVMPCLCVWVCVCCCVCVCVGACAVECCHPNLKPGRQRADLVVIALSATSSSCCSSRHCFRIVCSSSSCFSLRRPSHQGSSTAQLLVLPILCQLSFLPSASAFGFHPLSASAPHGLTSDCWLGRQPHLLSLGLKPQDWNCWADDPKYRVGHWPCLALVQRGGYSHTCSVHGPSLLSEAIFLTWPMYHA